MKQKLIIIGAGSVGKYIAYNQNCFGVEYDIAGILDDNIKKHQTLIAGIPVLGNLEKIHEYSGKGYAVVWGIAFPAIKKSLFKKYSSLEFDYPNFVAIDAWISEGVKLGIGCIIYPGCSVNYETTIQDFVVLNMNCAVGHNCQIGSFSSFSPGVNLGGYTDIGSEVELGIGCATLQGITVGNNTKVGGQAMVTKSLKSNIVVKGVPAQ